jgi:hypothetical protein
MPGDPITTSFFLCVTMFDFAIQEVVERARLITGARPSVARLVQRRVEVPLAVGPATLACHHGSVKGGHGVQGYLRALRRQWL